MMRTDVSDGQKPGFEYPVWHPKLRCHSRLHLARRVAVERQHTPEGHYFRNHPDRKISVVVTIRTLEVLHESFSASIGLL